MKIRFVASIPVLVVAATLTMASCTGDSDGAVATSTTASPTPAALSSAAPATATATASPDGGRTVSQATERPGPRDAAKTSCTTYASDMSKSERADMAGRILTTLRDKKKAPSPALTRTFANDINEMCVTTAERGDEEVELMVGTVAGYLYLQNRKTFNK